MNKRAFLSLLMFLGSTGLPCFAFKLDLYSGLNQVEANQMLALLLSNGISARKQASASDPTLTLSVEKAEFVQAMELLEQHGFPKPSYVSVNDLFPSNQLVSSPSQEMAKLIYLKEQRLERLLSNFEGVMQVSVVIAQGRSKAGGKENEASPSVAVFMKYSPEVNLESQTFQICSLIKNSVPNLDYGSISLVLQPADQRQMTKWLNTSPEPPRLAPTSELKDSSAVR